MYDFKNNNYYCVGNLAKNNYNFSSLDKNAKYSSRAKVLKFNSKTSLKPRVSTSGKSSSCVINFVFRTLSFLVLSALIALFIVNFPQVLNWLVGIVIAIFEFVFAVVEIAFSLIFLAVFFFLFGIFVKWIQIIFCKCQFFFRIYHTRLFFLRNPF